MEVKVDDQTAYIYIYLKCTKDVDRREFLKKTTRDKTMEESAKGIDIDTHI